jgi:chromosome partitioning protein
MPLVLVVAGLKGGVGKSTLALNIACALHRDARPTLLVDADSQGTLRTWAAKAAEAELDGPPVVALDGRSLRRDLERVSGGFELVVVDSPARLGTEARAAMIVADAVLLPVAPGAADVWALRSTLDVLDEARGLRPDLRAAVVLNRVDRSALAAATREAVAGVAADVPVLDAELRSRVAYGEATLAGRGVVDHAPRSPAAAEVRELTRAVLALAGATKAKRRNG